MISIPVLLLWSVQINLRQKVGLEFLLCLSVFAIIANTIRAAGHELKNGQQDGLWIDLWVGLEACVAIVANSMTGPFSREEILGLGFQLSINETHWSF